MSYLIQIDGRWTHQTTMFSRADMAFWGFSGADVTPPAGHCLMYLKNGEPYFRAHT